jgi:cell division septation protein DedD
MAENRRGRGSYYLSRGQLLTLAVGFTLTSALIFFLGVLLGQRIEERKLLRRDDAVVKIPLQPEPQASATAAGAAPKEEITFYDALTQKPGAASVPRAESKRKGGETKVAQKEAQSEKTDSVKKPEVASVAAGKGTAGGDGAWSVQVNAFPVERDARRLAKRLTDRGYDAFVVTADIGGKTWYRVRVGRFATRSDAKALQEELQTKEKFTKAITVSR